MRKNAMKKNHVAPGCEIPAGIPLAGRRMNTVVTQQVDIVFQAWGQGYIEEDLGGFSTLSRVGNPKCHRCPPGAPYGAIGVCTSIAVIMSL